LPIHQNEEHGAGRVKTVSQDEYQRKEGLPRSITRLDIAEIQGQTEIKFHDISEEEETRKEKEGYKIFLPPKMNA